MANIILPIVSTWLALGKTIDITNYKLGDKYNAKSIFNDTGFVESRVDVLNSTYYVLQDSKFPYSAMGIPIDLVLRIKSYAYETSFHTEGIPDKLRFRGYDSAVLLLVTDYRTVDRSLKENTVPLPDWKKKIPQSHTHYVEKMQFGGRCIALHRLVSSVSGDAQILRRILTDTMGSSGQIGKDTVDLWNKADKAIDESPDIRGNVYTKMYSADCRGILPPMDAYSNIQNMLKYMPDASKFVVPYDKEKRQLPFSVSLKSLHSLDEQYPAVEKNLETEEYIEKLDDMEGDLKYAYDKYNDVVEDFPFSVFDRKDIISKCEALEKKIERAMDNWIKPTLGGVSFYKDVNKTNFNNFFEIYQSGLDKGSEDYYSAVKRLDEDIGARCVNKFRKPTSGLLKVQDSEVHRKVLLEGGLEECQKYCEDDKKCRAVGYADTTSSGKGKQCWIYYRSTDTATIYTPGGYLSDMKIYDRQCKKV